MNRSQTVVAGFLLVVACLSVAYPARFRTDATLEIHSNSVWWSVQDSPRISADFATTSARAIEIRAFPSVFTTGCEQISLQSGSEPPERLPDAPATFRFSDSFQPPTGDWWTERFRINETPERVYFRELHAQLPIRLHFTFRGRTMRATSILIHGDQTITVRLNRGLLYHNYEILAPNGGYRHAYISPLTTTTLLANVAEPFLRSAAAAGILIVLFAFAGWKRSFLLTTSQTYVERVSASLLPRVIVFSAAGFFLWLCLHTSYFTLEKLPHFEDEVVYLLRSKWLLAGKLFEQQPPFWEHLQLTFTIFDEGRWMGIYPIGWPLLLTPGVLFDAPWIIAPIFGCASLLLLFRTGQTGFDARVGTVAALLMATSPVAILLSSSLFSHAASAFFVMAAVYCLVASWKKQATGRWLWLSGVAVGFVSAMRPLTALTVSILLVVFMLLYCENRARGSAFFFAGLLAGALPALFDNWMQTGNPLRYVYMMHPHVNLGFSRQSLMATDSTMAQIPVLLFGWGWKLRSGWLVLSLAYAFSMIPFILRKSARIDYLLASIFFGICIAYSLYPHSGAHGYGPRYYYEAFFCLYLLSARGFVLLSESFGNVFTGRLIAYGLLAALAASALVSLPQRLSLYRHYNDVDARFGQAITGNGITSAVVLLKPGTFQQWASAATFIPASLDSPIIVGGWQDDNASILNAFPDRPAYIWENDRLIRMNGSGQGNISR